MPLSLSLMAKQLLEYDFFCKNRRRSIDKPHAGEYYKLASRHNRLNSRHCMMVFVPSYASETGQTNANKELILIYVV